MTTPGTNRQVAVANATSLLASFCGRTPDGTMRVCQHDHSGDGEALVRMVEQYAFPDLLRELIASEHGGEAAMDLKIEELERRATTVPPR